MKEYYTYNIVTLVNYNTNPAKPTEMILLRLMKLYKWWLTPVNHGLFVITLLLFKFIPCLASAQKRNMLGK